MNIRRKKRLRLGFRLKSLDTVLIIGVACLMFFVLVVFGTYTRNVKTSEDELISLVLERMSVNQKVQFESYIDDKIQVLTGLAAFPEVYELDDKALSALLRRKAENFGFEYFFVMKADGTGFYFDEGNVYRKQAHEPFFQHIMENEVYLTEPFYSNNKPAITTVCVSIRNLSGKKVGVLCGALNLESIQSIIETSELVLEGTSFVLNSAGNYISSNDPDTLHNGGTGIFDLPDSNLTLITKAFEQQKDQSGTITIRNTDCKAYVSYLSDFNWVLVQCIPVSEVTARFQYIGILQYIMAVLSISLIVCIIRIIARWRRSDKKIYTDVLTGCGSRAACLNLLESLEPKKDMRISVLYMDLNRFKYVNDTYGHEEGDRLLQIFGTTLTRVFDSIGFVGRHGGDEFIVVLADKTDEEIEALCKKTTEYLHKESKKLSYPYTISTSYGYASREVNGTETLETVMQQADGKMYHQKSIGR